VSNEVYAALFGVLAGGFIQTIIACYDRKREAESVLTALAAEVDAICRLVRHRRYLVAIRELLQHVKNGGEPAYLSIDIRQNYFAVFDALAPKLGMLSPKKAAIIVNFYAYCKSVIDSTHPDGNLSAGARPEDLSLNIVEVERLMTAVLSLGDEIVQMPELSLATTEA
jgi:hypothetical protein